MKVSKIIKQIYSNIQILESNVYYSKNNIFELTSMHDILKKVLSNLKTPNTFKKDININRAINYLRKLKLH